MILLSAPASWAGEEPVNLGNFQVKGDRGGENRDEDAERVVRPILDRRDISSGSQDSDAPQFDLAPLESRPQSEDRPIRPIELASPTYPRRAAREGLSGYVTVEFTVDAHGHTTDIEVVDARPARVFDGKAVAAVRKWRFEPAIRDGEAVAQRVEQTIGFGDPESPEREGGSSLERLQLTDERAPEPVKVESPKYPRRALRNRETGEVTVAFTVNVDGGTEAVEIVDSSSRWFSRAAKQAVEQWKFNPAVRDGEPVPVRVEHTIPFDL